MFEDGISEATGEALLIKDVQAAENAVLRSIRVPITDGQFDALVSFLPGGGALQRSTLRRKVNREDHDKVPRELMRCVWAGGRKPKGLIRHKKQSH